MITSIRKNLNSPAVHSLMITAMLTMVLVPLLTAILGDRMQQQAWAIKVNDTIIGQRDFDVEVQKQQQYISAIRSQYGQFADYILQMYGLFDPRQSAANTLIQRSLLDQLARTMGITIHHDYLVKKLYDQDFSQKYLSEIVPPYLYDQDGVINNVYLREYLQRMGIDSAQFELDIADALARNSVVEVLSNYGYVPQFEREYAINKDAFKKQFAYISYDLSEFKVAAKADFPMDTLQKFYDNENRRAHRYMVPEKRGGVYWEFTPGTYGVVVNDGEIENYYQQHKMKEFVAQPTKVSIRKIVIPMTDDVARAQVYDLAQEIHQKALVQPDEFAQLAKEYSQDDTAKNGGLIEPFVRGSQPLPIDKAAFTLQDDGEIAPLITMDDQFVIVQRVSRTPSVIKPLNEVAKDIEKTLQKRKFAQIFNDDARLSNIVTDQQALQVFIAQHGGVKHELLLQERAENSMVRELFVLPEIDLRTVIMNKDNGVIVQLDEVERAYTPKLEKITSQVYQDWMEHNAQQKMQDVVRQAYEQALQGNWEKKPTMTRHLLLSESDDVKAVTKLGLDVSSLRQMDVLGAVIKREVGDKIFIIRLQDLEKISTEQSDEQREKLVNQLENERKQQFFGSFIAHLHRTATIKTSDLITITS